MLFFTYYPALDCAFKRYFCDGCSLARMINCKPRVNQSLTSLLATPHHSALLCWNQGPVQSVQILDFDLFIFLDRPDISPKVCTENGV